MAFPDHTHLSLHCFPHIFLILSTNSTRLSTAKQMLFFLLNRGSNVIAPVLLNLLNELGKVIKCKACRAFVTFSQRVKFNNTGALA